MIWLGRGWTGGMGQGVNINLTINLETRRYVFSLAPREGWQNAINNMETRPAKEYNIN